MGFEPMASSLPRKCSTAELHRLLSGRRGSNPRPIAWKAIALPAELLPLFGVWYDVEESGGSRIRTCEGRPMDLQSIPVDRLGIPPLYFVGRGAVFKRLR